MLRRRDLLIGVPALAAAVLLDGRQPARAAGEAQLIRMRSTEDGSDVWFDPIGLWVPPGTTVTWSNGANEANTHTTTAYHPSNQHHSLRIPEGAKPWDSGFLLPGKSFSTLLTVEGVYDYFCQPHELAGMVGRIIVGHPSGPGALPFDWFTAKHPDWVAVPDEARRAFPDITRIMRDKVVQRKV